MSQEKKPDAAEIDLQIKIMILKLLQVAVAMVPLSAAIAIGKRLSLFAGGGILPEGETRYDTSSMAALLNLSEQGVRVMAVRNKVPSTKPGDRFYFRPSDFVGAHADLSESESGEVVPTGCLDRQKSKIARRKPRKK